MSINGCGMSEWALMNYRRDLHCHCNTGFVNSLFTHDHCGASCFFTGMVGGILASVRDWAFNAFSFCGGMGYYGGISGGGNWWDALNPANYLGGGCTRTNTQTRDYSEYLNSDNGNKSGVITDEDNNKIIELQGKIDNAKTPEEIQGYITELNRLKGDLTDNYTNDKPVEELAIDNLIKQAEVRKTQLSANDPSKKIEDLEEKQTEDDGPKTITISTVDDVKNLTPEQIATVDAQKAKAILNKIGYLDGDNGKFSTEYNILLLLQKAGVNVVCAENPKAKDSKIQGKISDVKLEDGNLSYVVDNGAAEGDYRYKYVFKQVDDENGKKAFSLTSIESQEEDKVGYVDKNWKTRKYVQLNEKQALKIANAPALVTSKQIGDRLELKGKMTM